MLAEPQKFIEIYPNEKGVALITALLVVALVTVTVVAMVTRQQLDIRRTSNILQRDQAYVFTLGGEAFATQVLKKDPQGIDHRGEDWAIKLPPFPFKDGVLIFSLDDLSGRFNINNLVDADGVVSPWDVRRLRQMIEIIQDLPDQPDEFKQVLPSDLVNAMVDWIDEDGDVRSGGAEDGDYLDGELPYRTANQLMASPSELLLVKGVTPLIYKILLPYVATLPGRTKINVNTAKEELLQALADDITCPLMGKINIRSEGISIQDKVENKGAALENYDTFNKVNDFKSGDAFGSCDFVGIAPTKPAAGAKRVKDPQKIEDVFDVKSEYFLLDAYAEVGSDDHLIRAKLYSLLERKNGKITSLMRAQGTY
ncbi:MAG: type II secretion system minor pseudopilin GspK [Gammaproteobacteria bacterium]|nr:type II secretion system minor pseudopilin GspK [Gammaproteobacteria bacterium]